MRRAYPIHPDQLVQAAAANNAHWCHRVCRANGAPGQFNQHTWSTRAPVPRYYPNLITLAPSCRLETVQPLIQQMPAQVSMKDSFNQLAMTQLGFEKLFDAQWLLAPSRRNRQANYQLVTTVTELAQWEWAWSGAPPSGLFNATLLNDPSIRFIAIHQAEEVVAGGIVNKSGGSVGLTNFFCPSSDPTPYWLICLTAAQRFGGGVPVFCYASGQALEQAKSIGFRALGPLSVWQKD